MAFIHQTSWKGSRLGLERIELLMHRLGDPQNELRCVHIAGTNGKGSTATMLASVLTQAGYKTGLYTSPYIYRFHERVKIDGEEISDEALAALAARIKPQVESMVDQPTEFEIITALTFLYFKEQNCDIVVLEVGLGGRLESTNIIRTPEVAVITSIGLDHTDVLGDSLEAIAMEKAGIIKAGAPVVLYHQSRVVTQVIRAKCEENGSPLTITDDTQLVSLRGSLDGQVFHYRDRRELAISLVGLHQLHNAAVALDTLDVLSGKGYHISEEAIRRGLAKTRWPGRLEVLCRTPLFMVDGAHNPEGAKALADCLGRYLKGKKLTFLVGVMADKDDAAMIAATTPFAVRYITVTPENPRALPSATLKSRIEEVFSGEVIDAGGVTNGLRLALAGQGDVCAFGSLYMIGAIRAYFGLYETESKH
jgi:dihydrofolate synthase/folylpolyglutamate synthase